MPKASGIEEAMITTENWCLPVTRTGTKHESASTPAGDNILRSSTDFGGGGAEACQAPTSRPGRQAVYSSRTAGGLPPRSAPAALVGMTR